MFRIGKRNWTRAGMAALAALLASMVALNIARSEELERSRARVSAMYQKAFYETCELTEAVASNYRKLLVAADAAQMQYLLGEIARQTQGAAGNLALLPLGEEAVSATLKFVNQAEDFAASLSQKLSTGESASEADYQTMEALSEGASRFALGLGRLLEKYERGEAAFDAEDFSPTGDERLYPLTSEAGEYPVLLYDGPFSDGASTGGYEALRERAELSREEAEQRLRDFIPVDELSYVGESHPEVDIYEFRVVSGGYVLSAGITKQGGEVLYLLPEDGVEEARLGVAELCDAAEAFLLSRGYGEMEMSYHSRFGGILTINFAPVQGGVVLYPDLIKVQLSMKDGRVIGLDAKNYLRNHRPRDLASPALAPEEALERVGSRLEALSARLCLIPQERAEILCYEIAAADERGDFLVYIDAQTGAERELMLLVSRENGTLVM